MKMPPWCERSKENWHRWATAAEDHTRWNFKHAFKDMLITRQGRANYMVVVIQVLEGFGALTIMRPTMLLVSLLPICCIILCYTTALSFCRASYGTHVSTFKIRLGAFCLTITKNHIQWSVGIESVQRGLNRHGSSERPSDSTWLIRWGYSLYPPVRWRRVTASRGRLCTALINLWQETRTTKVTETPSGPTAPPALSVQPETPATVQCELLFRRFCFYCKFSPEVFSSIFDLSSSALCCAFESCFFVSQLSRWGMKLHSVAKCDNNGEKWWKRMCIYQWWRRDGFPR